MNRYKWFAPVAAAVIFLASCGKNAPNTARYLPKETGLVMAIDGQRMMAKLQKDSISIDSLFEIFKDTSANFKQAFASLTEVKDAGIDFNDKTFVGMMGNAVGSGEVELVASVKDADKLEAFIKKQPHVGEIKKGDGYSFVSKNNAAFGWNKEALIVVAGKPAEKSLGFEDSLKTIIPKKDEKLPTPEARLNTYFNESKSESMVDVTGFGTQISKPVDIAFFSHSEKEKNFSMTSIMMPKLSELTEGTYSYGTINFENGKAVFEGKTAIGEKLAALLQKNISSPVDLSLLENYPSANVDGVLAFSFKPEIITDFIKESGGEAAANLYFAKVGLTPADISKMFKGDFAMAVSDFGMMDKNVMPENGLFNSLMPKAKMILAAKIGDKMALGKLIAIGEKSGFITKQGNDWVISKNIGDATGASIVISMANDVFTLASDATTLAAYQSKQQKISLPEEAKSNLKGAIAGMFIDVEKMISAGQKMNKSTDVENKATLEKARATFKNAWGSFYNVDGNGISQKGEIMFIDTAKNSLSQLVDFMKVAAINNKAQKERFRNMESQIPPEDVRVDPNMKMPGD